MEKQIKNNLLLLLVLVSIGVVAQNQHPSIGGYHVYYGDLHNHDTCSDGEFSPDTMYMMARTRNKMDFYALTDHSCPWYSAATPLLYSIADHYNDDGVFCALVGFEWTSDIYGHMNVFCSDEVFLLNPNSADSTFCTFIERLSTQDKALAFFNHPGLIELSYSSDTEFYKFDSCCSAQVVGQELFNGQRGWYDESYGFYHATAADSLTNFFAEANQKGWRVGPMGNSDSHHEPTSRSHRTVILADSLTRDNLFSALRLRRFYPV